MSGSPCVNIIGAGLAGLSAALELSRMGISSNLISSQPSERAQSVMAEGGINAAMDTMGESDSVQAHFEDPEKSWDEAVSLNHNGSSWIIENLTKAAKNAYMAREIKFDRLLNGNSEGLLYWVKCHISDTALLQLIEHLMYTNIEK